MGGLMLAAILLGGCADHGLKPGVAVPGPAESASQQSSTPRTAHQLRQAVREALRRWARAQDEQADRAAVELLGLFAELKRDKALARAQRARLMATVRSRLLRLSEQISRRIARQKRSANTAGPRPSAILQQNGEPLAQRAIGGNLAAGVRATGLAQPQAGPADYGEQLVELIQRTVAPHTWDVAGGSGTIFYWYPGRALVVRQTDEVHERIDDLLRQLERANR